MTGGSGMPSLVVTRGLVGSGKTTFAEGYRTSTLQDDGQCLIAGRDHLRRLMGLRYGDTKGENVLTAIQTAMVRAALRAGADVVVDDMNLHSRDMRRWADLGARSGAALHVMDLTDTPVDLCVARDAERPAVPEGERWRPGFRVGEQVIRDKWTRSVKGQPYPLPMPEPAAPPEPYAPPPGKPAVILVDLDGTVALHVDRSPYDETRVSEDLPNEPVLAAVQAMHAAGYRVVFMSGRSEDCRVDTEKWLDEHFGGHYEALYMRPSGDSRRDSVVKLELFDWHIRDNYRVGLVFDDRNQVIELWRDLGLTAAQVADGDF